MLTSKDTDGHFVPYEAPSDIPIRKSTAGAHKNLTIEALELNREILAEDMKHFAAMNNMTLQAAWRQLIPAEYEHRSENPWNLWQSGGRQLMIEYWETFKNILTPWTKMSEEATKAAIRE